MEDGRFVASSYRGRRSGYSAPPDGRTAQGDLDALACTNACAYGPEQLDARMIPTTTEHDATARVRPWLERIDGRTNWPADLDGEDVFACFAPQGVRGCGFVSPLAALERALERVQTPGAPEYGFLRAHATLLVVILTLGHECSTQDPSIFAADGARRFWTDPQRDRPTPGVCWRAGVACSGGPGEYDTCEVSDVDASGSASPDPRAAALVPVDRVVQALQAIEDAKKVDNADAELIVSIVTGVGEDYAWGQQEVVYADAADPAFQLEHGIGPGCADFEAGFSAQPPVRLRDFGAHFGDRNLYSACGDEYSRVLGSIRESLDPGRGGGCFRACADDVDPEAAGLQPECVIEQAVPGQSPQRVVPCELADERWRRPVDADVCWAVRTDATQTGPSRDDMIDECVDAGSNLELFLLRREDLTPTGGTAVSARCRVSPTPDLDCPQLE